MFQVVSLFIPICLYPYSFQIGYFQVKVAMIVYDLLYDLLLVDIFANY
jgi:hypothetical protein